MSLVSIIGEHVTGNPDAIALHWFHVDAVAVDDNGSPCKLTGRLVRLDKEGGIVYQHPTTKESFDEQVASGSLKILIPCTGAQMIRAKSGFREVMPQWCVQMRAWHETKIVDLELGNVERDPCHFCGERDSIECPTCQVCPACQLYAHPDCTSFLLDTEASDAVAGNFKSVLESCVQQRWAGSTETADELLNVNLFFPLSQLRASSADEHAKLCNLCWPLLEEAERQAGKNIYKDRSMINHQSVKIKQTLLTETAHV